MQVGENCYHTQEVYCSCNRIVIIIIIYIHRKVCNEHTVTERSETLWLESKVVRICTNTEKFVTCIDTQEYIPRQGTYRDKVYNRATGLL